MQSKIAWELVKLTKIVESEIMLTSLIYYLVNCNLKSWVIASIIGFITYYLLKFYLKVKQYPPGPIPLPIVGTLLGNTCIYSVKTSWLLNGISFIYNQLHVV